MRTEDTKDPAVGPAPKGVGGVSGIELPPDRVVWGEARRYSADRNARVEDFAACASQDPVLVLELLKTANALFFSGGRQPILSVKTALVRLGSDVVTQTLETMASRADVGDPATSRWVEIHRKRCRRTAILSRMFAEASARTLADECQTAGLFIHFGEMLAAVHFGPVYTSLAEELSRSGLLYRLAHEHKFDVEQAGLGYLARAGIPQQLLTAIDRSATQKIPSLAPIKPVVSAAAELLDAFDGNRWEKLAPGKALPPKSAVRTLQLPESQYLKIYERAAQYLYSTRAAEEKRVADVAPERTGPEGRRAETGPDPLDLEIDALIEAVSKRDGGPEDDDATAFGLTPPTAAAPAADAAPAASVLSPRPPLLARAEAVVGVVTSVMESASTSEELLKALLDVLVDEGPFEKSALIVVSKDRRQALVVAARGPLIGNGQRLQIDDPLSPLAQCFSKVQSFGNAASKSSPFGSKTFAVSPVSARHETPVALYADCGSDGSITFEARRVFRTVVDVLNRRLPELPGGIPVEVGF